MGPHHDHVGSGLGGVLGDALGDVVVLDEGLLDLDASPANRFGGFCEPLFAVLDEALTELLFPIGPQLGSREGAGGVNDVQGLQVGVEALGQGHGVLDRALSGQASIGRDKDRIVHNASNAWANEKVLGSSLMHERTCMVYWPVWAFIEIMPSGPREPRMLSTEIFGKPVRLKYSETWVGTSLLVGRLIMAYIFLQSGLEKLFDPTWSAQGFLANAVQPGNPFHGFFTGMAGSVVVDQLVVWGQILIGIALLLGLLTRFAAFWGALMMMLFWMASLEGGLTQGLPVEHGWVVTYHLVYVVLLFALGAWGAGRVLGLDRRIEDSSFVRDNPWLRYVLG